MNMLLSATRAKVRNRAPLLASSAALASLAAAFISQRKKECESTKASDGKDAKGSDSDKGNDQG